MWLVVCLGCSSDGRERSEVAVNFALPYLIGLATLGLLGGTALIFDAMRRCLNNPLKKRQAVGKPVIVGVQQLVERRAQM